MALWGNIDYANGNNKPKYANTANAWSTSTINGAAANTNKYYGFVYGVSETEAANTEDDGIKTAHAGWVSQKIGTGPISGVSITTRGQNINAAGFLIVTDTSVYGQGKDANISFTIANTENTLQAFSINSYMNGIATVTIVNGGSLYSDSTKITLAPTGTNTTLPTFAVTLGGRAGRKSYETLVAMGSISGDDPRDNAYFTGV